MTNTEETQVGKWIGWNGGECPVHPMTTVEAVFYSFDGKSMNASVGEAYRFVWDTHLGTILAYRVIKEYREPRELYLTFDKEGRYVSATIDEDIAGQLTPKNGSYAKFREVIE